MKRILYVLKICLVPILFESTILLAQAVGVPHRAEFVFYVLFAFLCGLCFLCPSFLMQVAGGFAACVLEALIIDRHRVLLDYCNAHFQTRLTTRNTTDDFLICVLFQFIAFIAAALIALGKKKAADT